VAARWLLYAGLAVLLGAALAGAYVVGGPLPRRALLVAGALAAVAGSVATMLAEQHAVGVGLGAYLRTGHGTLLLREAACCLVAGLAAVGCLRLPRRAAYVVLGLLTAEALAVHAVTGHAGAAAHLRWPTIGVQWLHLLAVAAWIGSLAWALAALPREPGARAAAALRLSRVATVAVVVVAVTGTARALAEVASWHLLWATGFGRTVVAKVAVFLLLLALGARNKLRLVPGAAADLAAARLRRAVSAEVVFGGVAFALTGVLAGLAPATAQPVSPRPAAAAPVVVRGNDYATSVRVALTVTPGGIGPNTFAADVTDYDSGAPADARRVALRFTLPGRPDLRSSTLELTRAGTSARWSGSGPNLSVDGPWHVVVVVDAGAAGVEVPLTVTPAPPPETLRADVQPGQPTIYTATLPDGSTVQSYLDPDTAGFTEVHVTCFDPAGTERKIASLQVSVWSGERVATMKVRRFGPGHFVADTTLTAGRWHVAFRAVTASGAVLRGYADEDVRAKGP
jgi:putative copper export protein